MRRGMLALIDSGRDIPRSTDHSCNRLHLRASDHSMRLHNHTQASVTLFGNVTPCFFGRKLEPQSHPDPLTPAGCDTSRRTFRNKPFVGATRGTSKTSSMFKLCQCKEVSTSLSCFIASGVFYCILKITIMLFLNG